jgi:SMODS and SLOG-associating 2TM effector domain family 5
MSFFVVAFSLLQSSKRHDLRSEMFLKCAQAIDDIWTKLDRDFSLGNVTRDKFKQSDDEYQRVITNFTDNHADFDYQVFRFKTRDNPKRFERFVPRTWARARRIYWKNKVFFYIWKNVYLALLLPWLIFGIAYLARMYLGLI